MARYGNGRRHGRRTSRGLSRKQDSKKDSDGAVYERRESSSPVSPLENIRSVLVRFLGSLYLRSSPDETALADAGHTGSLLCRTE